MNRILILIIINLIFFLRTLWYGFVSDDCYALDVAKIVPKNKLHSFWLHIRGQKYTSGKLAHSLNIIVHTINCILIYLAFGRNGLSFLAALLFAVNPINTQGGSIWLSGRCYAIATMFSLLMFLIPLASPIFYYIANYFSFGAIISLFFFIPTKYWMMIFFMPLIFLVMRKKMLATRLEIKSTTATKTMKELRPYKLILFFKTFGYYTQLAIWPLRLGLYHPCLYLWGVSKQDNEDCLEIDWGFWKGLMIALIIGLLIIFNWGNPLGFGLWWWCVGILPWCNIITIQQAIAERYCYLPLCGLMYALAYFIIEIIGKIKI